MTNVILFSRAVGGYSRMTQSWHMTRVIRAANAAWGWAGGNLPCSCDTLSQNRFWMQFARATAVFQATFPR